MAKTELLLNIRAFEELQRFAGLGESQMANTIGISPEQLWRIKNRKTRIGEAFIAGFLVAFPDIDPRMVFSAQKIACTQAK